MNKENGKTIGDRKYDVQDYERKDSVSKGLAVTHEQVTDTLTEGTYDAKVDEDGKLKSNEGDNLSFRKK
ncbi:YozQ family protein [Halobacillus sp. A1]|uniref:YozQ family protein n=1 Tax=Halobacillus sp. A1 TaxID=2880262 RepID=UPI0020A6C934|nr:YozQ family protein [Halobacillus sp. A1]MCP3031332.1 YozQ family protein [Halobacillus sp. A1]